MSLPLPKGEGKLFCEGCRILLRFGLGEQGFRWTPHEKLDIPLWTPLTDSKNPLRKVLDHLRRL